MNDKRITIKTIQVKNFRSIRNQKIDVSNFNIFVGLNDAGKSNLLKALNLFFNEQTDYNTPFDFNTDFTYLFPQGSHNAKEIKISIQFSVPNSYKEPGIYTWEKMWRRDKKDENIFNSEGKKPAARSRIPSALRLIKYRYVPAVKSKDYYKGLLTELYLTASASLTSPLQNSIAEFSNVLKESTKNIGEAAASRLNINSELSMPDNMSDIFKALIFRTSTETEQMSISLEYRGDGIQARHIPIILKYIADEDQNSRTQGSMKVCTIWGFEEPENGVELLKAFEMASEFSEYANEIQLFISTHSPAFYMKKTDSETSVFFVEKRNEPDGTYFSTEKDSKLLVQNMGLMPLIAPYVSEKISEINTIKQELINHPLTDINTILVEGITDKYYIEAAIKRYSQPLQMLVENGELRVYTKEGEGGSSNMVSIAKAWIYNGNKKRLFLLFDKDEAGKNAKISFEDSVEYVNKGKFVRINSQFLQPNEDLKLLYKKHIDLPFEIEHLLSKEMWKRFVEKNYITRRSPEELQNVFGSVGDIDTPLIDTIRKLVDDNELVETIVLNNPSDEKKQKIKTLVYEELNSNPKSEVLIGFKTTVAKIEQAFNVKS